MEEKIFTGFIKVCVAVVYAAGASWVVARAYASAKKALKAAEAA
jgi:hypothetical protein